MAVLSLSPPLPVFVASGKKLTVSNTLTLAGVDGKTLTVNNSLTLAGTDGTTMTFPGASDTVAGLGTVETFSANQSISTSTTGSPLTLTATGLSQFDAGLLRLHMNTAGFNNPIFWISTNFAFSSGWFIYCDSNGTAKFQVKADGSITAASSLTVGSGNGGFDSSGRLLLGFQGVGAATGTATLGRIPTGQTTTAMSNWATGMNAGTSYRWPVWLNS